SEIGRIRPYKIVGPADVEEVWSIYKQHLNNLRRKDSQRGAETTEISVRPGNFSAWHFKGSAKRPLSRAGRQRRRRGAVPSQPSTGLWEARRRRTRRRACVVG